MAIIIFRNLGFNTEEVTQLRTNLNAYFQDSGFIVTIIVRDDQFKSEKIFKNSITIYQNALNDSNFKHKLKYSENKNPLTKKKRN